MSRKTILYMYPVVAFLVIMLLAYIIAIAWNLIVSTALVIALIIATPVAVGLYMAGRRVEEKEREYEESLSLHSFIGIGLLLLFLASSLAPVVAYSQGNNTWTPIIEKAKEIRTGILYLIAILFVVSTVLIALFYILISLLFPASHRGEMIKSTLQYTAFVISIVLIISLILPHFMSSILRLTGGSEGERLADIIDQLTS